MVLGRDYLNVLVASKSNLFLEALQLALDHHRPNWYVSSHLLQGSSGHRFLNQKIKTEQIDIVVIEITDVQHFSIAIQDLKKLTGETTNGVLLVDSKAGEVYHHLKNEEQWIGVLKNISLSEFLKLLENFTGNIPKPTQIALTERDTGILKGLATGQTFEFLQHAYGLSIEEIESSIFRMNAYFKVPNYMEAVQKAIEQNVITV